MEEILSIDRRRGTGAGDADGEMPTGRNSWHEDTDSHGGSTARPWRISRAPVC